MKKIFVLIAALGLSSVGWADTARQSAIDRIQDASVVLQQIMAAPDKGIPDEVMEHAKCIAVVPHLVKAGFVFGGEGGSGVATCRTAHGWSAPVFFNLAGGSWGLQIGVEGVDLVMVFQNEKGMQELLSSKFQLGAGASVAAGPVGRHATADTDWKMNAEILTYSRAKGVFAGLTLHGAVISHNEDAMRAMYGPNVTARAVLDGQIPAPSSTHPFLAAVRKADDQARASG